MHSSIAQEPAVHAFTLTLRPAQVVPHCPQFSIALPRPGDPWRMSASQPSLVTLLQSIYSSMTTPTALVDCVQLPIAQLPDALQISMACGSAQGEQAVDAH
jgi:hypothetical protein